MSIESIGLKNFTVFEDFRIDVLSGINIFIGENGTGKTHLLKAIYVACKLSRAESQNDELLKYFKEKQQETNLLRDKSIGQLTISIISKNITRKRIRGSELAEYFLEIPDGKKFPAVYIPVKDMLTHSAGFLAMANKYRDFPFDKTPNKKIPRAEIHPLPLEKILIQVRYELKVLQRASLFQSKDILKDIF